MTTTDDGRLFAAQCFHGEPGGVYELDPTGQTPPQPILEGIDGCASNGMAWHDGALYTPRWFEDRITRIDVEDGTVSDVTVDWDVPAAVAFDSKGNLHAVSQATGEVARIDLQTGARTVVAQLPIGLDNLAFDADDRLFVSSATDAFIVEVEADGTTRTVSEGGLTLPMSLAVLGDTLWVGEGLALRSFDRESGEARDTIRTVLGIGPLPAIPVVMAAWDQRLLMLDPFFGAVALYDPESGDATEIPAFAGPVDIEPFGAGVAVSELGSGSVVLASGPILATREPLVTGLAAPAGLAAAGDDLYVGDMASGHVYRVVEGGEILDPPQPVTEVPLAVPEGIAGLDDTHLAVVEGATGRLLELNLETGATHEMATDLAFLPALDGLPPHMNFNDVLVMPDGELLINGDAAAVIYALQRE